MVTLSTVPLPPLSPLALQVRRATGSVVGRPAELAAIEQELENARARGLSALTVEGEPGIGKTRLLLAAAEIAAGKGFVPIAVAADEELRGPFLVARGIFASPAALEALDDDEARDTFRRALDAVSGRPEPGLESLPADRQLLRAFDLGALALATVASRRPVALLIDDLQWADEDSLRMLRYVVRADAASPLFLMASIRPEEMALVNEAVTLVADMERMGLVRRMKVARFTQVHTGEFVRQLLGGKLDMASAAAMHAQAEGVPFIVEELAHTYRDAGMIQQIDGVWTLARNAERLVPSAVRTLIQRRAARLPDDTRASLAEAAILGRSFSVRDLAALKQRLGDAECDAGALAEALRPAVDTGLLVQHPPGSAADYSFAHDQVREFATAGLTAPRRRAVHAAILGMLSEAGEPAPESLPLLTHHALAAGDAIRCTRFSCQAAAHALESKAPEEVLRVVELGLPAASDPRDRVALLRARDEALEMLRRPADRLEGLTELAALADAMRDERLELEIMLRRAAALRLSGEEDESTRIATRVAERAREGGDAATELAACLEQAQALLKTELGESFTPSHVESDLDAAEEVLLRAKELAEQLGDDAKLAAALRELGTITVARARAWFVEQILAGRQFEWLSRIAAGETTDDILPTLPIAPLVYRSIELFQQAIDAFERVGDRRGVMSTVIAMAYIRWGPEIHLTSSARYIEEIRRLSTGMRALTKESERLRADLQMLYGVHVYSRAKIVPDLALSRGEEAYRVARAGGERTFEFLAAGGVAMTHLDLGDVEEAERWLDRAASVASASPTPLRARQLETWRGIARSAAGDAAGMREHLERALGIATSEGQPAARCETLARLAVEAASLGAKLHDDDLLALAERSAGEAKELATLLPGRPPWRAQADAALADVALARGDREAAVAAAMGAISFFTESQHEDLNLEIIVPAARAVMTAGDEGQRALVGGLLHILVTTVAQRTLDEDVRVRWFRGPAGRLLADLAGAHEPATAEGAGSEPEGAHVGDADARLLQLLARGATNSEIAGELGIAPEELTRRLGETFARIGAGSRGEATAFAFVQRVL